MKNDFATKADLKKTADGLHHEISAVRTDLTRTEKTLRHEIAAIREDLHQEIVTVREDLHQEISEVKTELKRDIDRVAIQVVQVSTDINDFKIETRDRFDGVMTAIDGLAGIIKNGQTERAAVDHALRRHEGKLDNHETRIRSLEPKG